MFLCLSLIQYSEIEKSSEWSLLCFLIVDDSDEGVLEFCSCMDPRDGDQSMKTGPNNITENGYQGHQENVSILIHCD